MVRTYVYVSYAELAAESNTQNVRTPKKHQKVQCSRSKDRQDWQIIWEGKAKWYKLCLCFLRLRTSEPPNSTKGYTAPEIKDRQCLQIIQEGKAKWYEIMSMFPTELASESNTQNVRTPKKHQKVQCSKDKRSPRFANHMGGKSQMVRNYVYVSYTELAAESNTQNVRTPKRHQKDPKGIVFQR